MFKKVQWPFAAFAQHLSFGLGKFCRFPIEKGLDPGIALVRRRTQPAIGSNTTKAFGQDMLQEASNERKPMTGTRFERFDVGLGGGTPLG